MALMFDDFEFTFETSHARRALKSTSGESWREVLDAKLS